MNVKVKTNDGHVEIFNKKKIVDALINDHDFMVQKLGVQNGITEEEAKNIAGRVTRLINKLNLNDRIISSDTIRGLVSTELIEKQYFNLLGVSEIVGLRVKDIFNTTRGNEDNDNANLTPNPETSHKLIADNIMKKYYLRIFPQNIANAHIIGDIHVHDLEYFGTRVFCRSWDLRKFFYDGFAPDGENNGIVAGAPKHAEVAILQACKILAMGQCNHAGGQGLLYGTVFLAPYMMGKTYKEIKQLMQMMLYELNQMYVSRGGQTVFSSINISPGCPKVLENIDVVYQGEIWDGKCNDMLLKDKITYKDLEREIRLQFKALMELSLEGDASGKLFPFPKLEVAVEKKFIDESTWNIPLIEIGKALNNSDEERNVLVQININDEVLAPSYKELYELAFEVVAKTGILYFDNLLPEKKNADNGVGCTQCCSYSFATDENSDNDFKKELNFEDGYFFRLGGMQACSINLPRLAYQSKGDIKILMALIFNNMDICLEVFKIKKAMINANIHRLKYLTQVGKRTQKLTDFDKLVYEIGIVGLNETLQEFTGYQIGEDIKAIDVGKHILSEMQKYCKLLSEFSGLKIVLARTPAETVAQRFAVSDILDERYREKALKTVKGDLETALKLCKDGNKNLPIYYSNGFAPYVGSTLSIFDKIRLENEFWPYVDGGAITHIWLGESNPDAKGLMQFAMNVFKNTDIGYLAFTKDLSQCMDCANIMGGLKLKCDKCNGDNINWFSRITGYYSEVAKVRNGIKMQSRWNEAKTQELMDRNKVDMEI